MSLKRHDRNEEAAVVAPDFEEARPTTHSSRRGGSDGAGARGRMRARPSSEVERRVARSLRKRPSSEVKGDGRAIGGEVVRFGGIIYTGRGIYIVQKISTTILVENRC
jgi:hypothetical protein